MMKLPCSSIAQKTARLKTKPELSKPRRSKLIEPLFFHNKSMSFAGQEAGKDAKDSFLNELGNVVGDCCVPCDDRT